MDGLKKIFYFLIIFISIIVFFLFVLLSSNSQKDFDVQFHLVDDEEIVNGTLCNVPKLNPWDPTIAKWIAHPKDLSCKQVQPNLTFIDYDGYLKYNESAVNILKESQTSFECTYKTFERCYGTDDGCISYSQKDETLKDPIKLSQDFVDVKCSYDNKTEFYRNLHAHPAETVDRIFAKNTDDQLSVLLLIIDSTSYSVLQRNMPLTYDYTKNVMGIKYFEAYNKVGDNSFPNMLAMLTGKRVFNEQEDMMQEIKFEYGTIKHDTLPLIWKMFSGKGYATAHNEDKPSWGLFHYVAKGFAKKPVDFFYHTFWRAISKAHNDNHTEYCFRNLPRPQILLDLTKRQVIAKSKANELQFLYSHSTEVTHDRTNEVEQLDEIFLQFFKELYDGNYLNKTMIIFAADHGHRFSAMRATIVGLLEERLPFYGLWFPSWFYKLHPHIQKNIDVNKRLLSSTFDAYETMIDVLDANYDGMQRKITSRGQSQLYPLPANRTCKSAGIPDHYCTCVKRELIDNKHKAATDSASRLIILLNEKLQNVSSICTEIRLKKILYASKIDFDDRVKNAIKNYDGRKEYDSKWIKSKQDKSVNKIQIGIETVPFNATFEAMMQNISDKNETVWVLDGGISRTNSYAGLSSCITDKILEKYCSCKNVTLSSNRNETAS